MGEARPPEPLSRWQATEGGAAAVVSLLRANLPAHVNCAAIVANRGSLALEALANGVV